MRDHVLTNLRSTELKHTANYLRKEYSWLTFTEEFQTIYVSGPGGQYDASQLEDMRFQARSFAAGFKTGYIEGFNDHADK